MRRLIALVLAVVAVAALFALPAFAEEEVTATTSVSEKVDLLPHLHPWRHKTLMIWDATEDTHFAYVEWGDMMTQEEMVDVMTDADPEMIPDDCEIRLDRITRLESYGIARPGCENSPFVVTFRVWEAQPYPTMVFFRKTVEDEWTLLKVDKGIDITVEFPCNGMYGVAKSWNW